MTYVVSNIHGEYEKFKELLNKINFCENDVMFILGDIVDYGEEPMELICDISMRYNVYPVVGEHDYNALRMLKAYQKIAEGAAPDPELMAEMTEWIKNGGMHTLEGFRELDADMQEGAIDYLSDMVLYEEVSVGGKDYIMVHAGIADFDEEADLDDYQPEDFFREPLDLEAKYFADKTLIVGHTPTEEGKIVYGNGSIAIDCGAGRGGKLGCLCLDNGKEFYVE